MACFLLMTLVLLGASAPRTGSLTKVWDAAVPKQLSAPLPVRIQSPGGTQTRIFAPDGSRAWEGTLCGEATANSLEPWADPDSTPGAYHGGCGEARFSRDGRLAVVLDSSVRDGPPAYVRPFDPDAHRFAAGRSYRPAATFWTWALGDSQVACFLQMRRDHVLRLAQCLRLEIVSRRAGSLHVEPVWEDSSYVEIETAAMNDAGDVVALVGKPGLDSHQAWTRALDTWALLIVPAGSSPRIQDVKGVSIESRVALSRDGRWIALSVRGQRAVRLIDARTLRQSGKDLVVSDAGQGAGWARVVGLAVAADRAIATTAFVCRGPGACDTRLFFGRGGLGLAEVQTYGPNFIEVELQFFADRYLYVANAGRPALAELGIGGVVERRVPAVESAASVFEY